MVPFQPCSNSLVKSLCAQSQTHQSAGPDLNPTWRLWDERAQRLWARPEHPMSALDLTDAPVDKWDQIPAAKLKTLVENRGCTIYKKILPKS